MNDEELGHAWKALEPTGRRRRRIDTHVFAWLEARDTPLAAEWLGLAAVSAVSIITAAPLIWFARALM